MNRPALIFDFGNVLAHFDYRRAASRLGEPLGLSGDALLDRLRPLGFNHLVRQYECGKLSDAQFAERCCALAGLRIPFAEFAAAWSDIFWLNEPVAELVRSLKTGGYVLVLGSNTNALHATHFRRQFAETLAHFDKLVLSYEVGAVKPAAEFYLACARAADVSVERCVFIDDLPENVVGARAAGLRAVHYQNPQSLRSELAAHGIVLAEP